MNPLFRIGSRVKVKTWPEIAEYLGLDYEERDFLELEGIVYDEANDDPIGLGGEMFEDAGKGESLAVSLKPCSLPTRCVTCVLDV